MSVPARVTLITLGVADVARATRFFESLGWERSPMSQESVTFLRTAGPVVALWGWDDLADDAALAVEPPATFRGTSLAINLESREAVDAAAAAWVAAGGRLVKQPEEVFWGGYSGYVADLDGHLWELAHNPFIPFKPDGTLELP
jgi:predicted lactoylglutathione lyase